MIEVLPEADLLKVQDFARKLSKRHEPKPVDEAAVAKFLGLKTAEDIYKDLEISRQQAAEGKYQEAGEFLAELRAEYGI